MTKDEKKFIKEEFERIRENIKNEEVSYLEIAFLQYHARFIDSGDVVLRQWADVPEDAKLILELKK